MSWFNYHSTPPLKRKLASAEKWTLEIPFKTGFTVHSIYASPTEKYIHILLLQLNTQQVSPQVIISVPSNSNQLDFTASVCFHTSHVLNTIYKVKPISFEIHF
jgi:hypothetical protein